MNTLIIAESRKLGVEWLNTNMPPNEELDKRRTQTNIWFKNGDTATVISKREHFSTAGMSNNDRAVIVGAVDQQLMNLITAAYNARGNTLFVEQQGQVLTPTELKRRQYLQQLEDLEKEERLYNFFNTVALDGIKFTKTEVNANNSTRSFSIVIQGKFS
jgi:hypothetical protein